MSTSLNFSDLRVANVRRGEEIFHPLRNWSPTEWACAVANKCGKACGTVESLRLIDNGTNTEKDPSIVTATIKDIADELADTVIYIDLLAARFEIDLGSAVERKFNMASDRMHATVFLARQQ